MATPDLFVAPLNGQLDRHGVYRIDTKIQWDDEKGELQELVDDQVRHVTAIRAKLMEDITRAAVVLELERLGYTVISPEVPT